jgi:hypothetical protein
VRRFLWIVAALFVLAGPAFLREPGADVSANAVMAIEDCHGADGSPSTGEPALPVDLDGEDDDADAQNEISGTRVTVAVPPSSVASYLAQTPPRLRAAPGHPQGIEEPPRA